MLSTYSFFKRKADNNSKIMCHITWRYKHLFVGLGIISHTWMADYELPISAKNIYFLSLWWVTEKFQDELCLTLDDLVCCILFYTSTHFLCITSNWMEFIGGSQSQWEWTILKWNKLGVNSLQIPFPKHTVIVWVHQIQPSSL